MSAGERRQRILELLCLRRQDTYGNLASEFGVSRETIRHDIVLLMVVSYNRDNTGKPLICKAFRCLPKIPLTRKVGRTSSAGVQWLLQPRQSLYTRDKVMEVHSRKDWWN